MTTDGTRNVIALGASPYRLPSFRLIAQDTSHTSSPAIPCAAASAHGRVLAIFLIARLGQAVTDRPVTGAVSSRGRA